MKIVILFETQTWKIALYSRGKNDTLFTIKNLKPAAHTAVPIEPVYGSNAPAPPEQIPVGKPFQLVNNIN